MIQFLSLSNVKIKKKKKKYGGIKSRNASCKIIFYESMNMNLTKSSGVNNIVYRFQLQKLANIW